MNKGSYFYLHNIFKCMSWYCMQEVINHQEIYYWYEIVKKEAALNKNGQNRKKSRKIKKRISRPKVASRHAYQGDAKYSNVIALNKRNEIAAHTLFSASEYGNEIIK